MNADEPGNVALFFVVRQPTLLSNAVPMRFANARESLEASFERIRLMEETPIAMELLNRNARRPKKVGGALCV